MIAIDTMSATLATIVARLTAACPGRAAQAARARARCGRPAGAAQRASDRACDAAAAAAACRSAGTRSPRSRTAAARDRRQRHHRRADATMRRGPGTAIADARERCLLVARLERRAPARARGLARRERGCPAPPPTTPSAKNTRERDRIDATPRRDAAESSRRPGRRRRHAQRHVAIA